MFLAGVEGPGLATHSRVLSTQAWYNFILVLMVNLVLSQTLQSTCQCCCCCFANSFFSSVSRESCWRYWSLQSWTKVLGTALQYFYFSVISRFPLKTVHHFGNFLAVLPPLTLYKVETRKQFWTRVQRCLWG